MSCLLLAPLLSFAESGRVSVPIHTSKGAGIGRLTVLSLESVPMHKLFSGAYVQPYQLCARSCHNDVKCMDVGEGQTQKASLSPCTSPLMGLVIGDCFMTSAGFPCARYYSGCLQSRGESLSLQHVYTIFMLIPTTGQVSCMQ